MTYSIVARNPDTRELGIAVHSRYFAAGRVVPWIEAGVGVVASQAFANPIYGHETLRQLRSGLEPQQILEKLLSADSGEATRQVAILDAQGRTAVQRVASAWQQPVMLSVRTVRSSHYDEAEPGVERDGAGF